jgi:hypothetical protein
MKTLFFFIVGLTLVLTISAQDTIHWRNNYALQWKDFQGTPDSNSAYKATTLTNLTTSISYNDSTFSAKVICVFYKKKSWALGGSQNLLLHEQGHFNLGELFARKLRKALKTLVFNPNTFEADFKKISSRIRIEQNQTNALYDKETNFSRNKQKQLQWDRKIQIELKKLNAYAN